MFFSSLKDPPPSLVLPEKKNMKAITSTGRIGERYAAAEKARKYIPGHPHHPFKGAHTKSDRQPMSTGEYSSHMRRIK